MEKYKKVQKVLLWSLVVSFLLFVVSLVVNEADTTNILIYSWLLSLLELIVCTIIYIIELLKHFLSLRKNKQSKDIEIEIKPEIKLEPKAEVKPEVKVEHKPIPTKPPVKETYPVKCPNCNAVLNAEKLPLCEFCGALVKPVGGIKRDLVLLHTHVAGTTHIDNIDVIGLDINEGDIVNVYREPNNLYDSNAIAVETLEGVRIGHVPKKENFILAKLLDAGEPLKGKITLKEYRGKDMDWLYLGLDLFLASDI